MISNKVYGGFKAKKAGEYFENLVQFYAERSRIVVKKIPDGAKVVKNRSRGVFSISIKSPFDFMVMKDKKCAFFDCKTIEDGNFSYSAIKPHQLMHLLDIEQQGLSAGYLIYYRDINKVVYYLASKLKKVERGSSIKEVDGIVVGDNQHINFDAIFSALT